MRMLVGSVLRILGWGLAIWSLVVALGFVGILMINFVGTHGAESGDDILVILGIGAAGTLLGVGIARLGKSMSTPEQ